RKLFGQRCRVRVAGSQHHSQKMAGLITRRSLPNNDSDSGHQCRNRGNQHCAGRMTSNPLANASKSTTGTSVNRFVPEPSFQILREFRGTRISLGGIFLQALEANDLQVAVQFRIPKRWATWLRLENL